MAKSYRLYVDVDMVLEPEVETRNASGRLCVQGEVRAQLRSLNIDSKIVDADGPAGCPVVRLHGSRRALTKFLASHDYDLAAHPLREQAA